MNKNVAQCSDRELLDVVRHDSVEAENQLLEHVEECSHCQQRLYELAGNENNWQEAAMALKAQAENEMGSFSTNIDPDGRLDEPRLDGEVEWTDEAAAKILEPPAHPEILGRLGRYQIERLIGSGGMGIVFKAFDTELNRTVAIKMLSPYLANSKSARQRFARESRSAAGVIDDHVVPIYNVDPANKPPYLVMQYIAGGSLQEKLDRDGPLEVAEIVRIGLQTSKGLVAAHAQGLIHRDVKPSNVLLDEGVERALLTDFGLARVENEPCLTRTGFQPGTPHYMSPEQVQGKDIDARSDLFGLGCLLYALCTGHSPFRAETSFAAFQRIVNESPQSIRELNQNIPSWLEVIISRLLSRSPDDRYSSADEVAKLLEGCLAHLQQPATTPLPSALKECAVEFKQQQDYSVLFSKILLASLFVLLGFIGISSFTKGTFDDTTKPNPELTGNTRIPSANFPIDNFSMGTLVEAKQDKDKTPEELEFEKLQREFGELSAKYSSALQQATNDEEVRRAYEELDPRELMPNKFLAFEEKHRNSPIALEALTIVSEMASSVGNPDSNAAKGRNAAFDRLIDHYLSHEGLEPTISTMSGGPPAPRAEEFLQLLVEKSPHKSVRAHALLAQIKIGKTLLEQKASVKFPEMKARYQEIIEHAPKKMAEQIQSMLEQIEALDADSLQKQLNEKLQSLGQDYADVEVQIYGTAGNASARISYAINKVVVGGQAPELHVTDLDGNSFKLSDYKGKIVVLLFTYGSQNTDYKEMYAPFRKLVAKYKSSPVHFVGVMGNSNKTRLQEAVSNGHINWTVISQKVNGPIQLNWGIEGFHYAYIIDTHGVLNPKQHMPYYGEGGYDTTDVDQKITQLLRKAARSKSED